MKVKSQYMVKKVMKSKARLNSQQYITFLKKKLNKVLFLIENAALISLILQALVIHKESSKIRKIIEEFANKCKL